MDVKTIKGEATQIYNKKKENIIPEFFYIGYVSLLAQYLQSGLFSFFVSLFLCPIAHGYVRSAIKLVEYPDDDICYKDSLVGVLEFIRVAPSYLARKFVILISSLIVASPMVLLGNVEIPEFSFEWLASLGNAFIQTELFIPNYESLSIFNNQLSNLVFIALAVIVYLYLTSIYIFVPYIIEEDEYSFLEALQLSSSIMSGNLLSYIKLYLCFFPAHFMYWLITGLCVLFISPIHEITSLICFVTSLFIYIEFFKGKFEIAKYIFYKEVRKDYLYE